MRTILLNQMFSLYKSLDDTLLHQEEAELVRGTRSRSLSRGVR